MIINADPVSIYKKRITEISLQLQKLNKKNDLIAWGRLFSILTIIGAFLTLKPYGYVYAFMASGLLTAIFLRLVVLSLRNKSKIKNLTILLQINESELEIQAGQFTDRPDGSEYLPELHPYAEDLDIFGKVSLYQYLNRTTSEQGHRVFAQSLLQPANTEDIAQIQEAAQELSNMYAWRQQFQAFGMANKINLSTQYTIESWLGEKDLFTSPNWAYTRFILPGLMLTALLMHIFGFLSSSWFYALVFLSFLVSGWISKKVTPVYVRLNKIVKEMDTLSQSTEWIEQQPFKSALLKKAKEKYQTGPYPASKQIKKLKGILDRMDYRLNFLVFIFLNIFLYWDLQQALALEKWKKENRHFVIKWFEALGEMEALSTIATIKFNHPLWVFPVLDKNHGTLKGKNFGHPLIPESKRVTNSFATAGVAKAALITGSNMAGKSTFLRSIGVNIVLAMMGAPVCAESMTVSHMTVISSMRISDNLAESTSTFYAELKKLKAIIEAVNRGEKVFLLLDEILRGTNSLDRQTGSKALLKQLIQKQAVVMLATHDLELAKMEKDYPENIHNYYFDVQVSGEELYFDYKLKEGVCKSLNASILMRKIGIELG